MRTELMRIALEVDSLESRTAGAINHKLGPYTIASPIHGISGVSLYANLGQVPTTVDGKASDEWYIEIEGGWKVKNPQQMEGLLKDFNRFFTPLIAKMEDAQNQGYYTRFQGVDVCEVCGAKATHFDHDLHSYFCQSHIQQPGYTTEL